MSEQEGSTNLCPWCLCPLPSSNAVMLSDYTGPACVCGDENEENFECTREAGHEGDHVLCGMHFHEVKRWKP